METHDSTMNKVSIYTEKDVSIKEVCKTLANGEIIAYPTDTLYALGANPQQSDAIKKLFTLKKRSPEKKVSYIFSDLNQVSQYAHLTDTARSLSKYLPGKLTIILKSKKDTEETVGVRIPDSNFCRVLATTYGPVTATSANISGEKDPCTIQEILEQIPTGIAMAIDAGELRGPASTVVDARGTVLKVVRQGAVLL